MDFSEMLTIFLPGVVSFILAVTSISLWLPLRRSDAIKKGVFIYALTALVISIIATGINPYGYGFSAVVSLFGTAMILPVCLAGLYLVSLRIPGKKA